MVALRSCCLCVSPRTGSFILATLGIVFGAVLLAPMAVFLDFHGYYVTHYVADARVAGNYIDDDQVINYLLIWENLQIELTYYMYYLEIATVSQFSFMDHAQ